jgi:hypothetical protein
MDSKSIPQLAVFKQLKLCMKILPYYSKSYDEWGDLMWEICYTTRSTWYKFEMAFLCEYMDCDFNFDEEIVSFLNLMGIDDCDNLPDSYNLTLNADAHTRSVKNFLAFAKTLRFRSIGDLKIVNMDQLDIIGTRYAAKFLKFSMPLTLKSVHLAHKQGEITPYVQSMEMLLPRVTRKITLSKFKFSEEELYKVRNFGNMDVFQHLFL